MIIVCKVVYNKKIHKEIRIEISEDATVCDLKKKIEKLWKDTFPFKIDVPLQILIFNKIILKDNEKLMSLQIFDNSKVFLVLKDEEKPKEKEKILLKEKSFLDIVKETKKPPKEMLKEKKKGNLFDIIKERKEKFLPIRKNNVVVLHELPENVTLDNICNFLVKTFSSQNLILVDNMLSQNIKIIHSANEILAYVEFKNVTYAKTLISLGDIFYFPNCKSTMKFTHFS